MQKCDVCGSGAYYSYLKEFWLMNDGYCWRTYSICSPACESLLRLRTATLDDGHFTLQEAVRETRPRRRRPHP